MFALQQSVAITVPVFAFDSSGDPVTGKVTGDWTKRISKASGAFAAMTVTVTEKEGGWYDLVMDTGHTNTLGILTVYLTATGVKQINLQWMVTLPGESGANVTYINGLATSGNNATLSLKQLSVVNSTGSAIVATSSGSNGHGMVLTGNGFGEGLSAQGGANGNGATFTGGADGNGATFTGGATSGDGLVVTAVSGDGIDASGGGAAGTGLRLVGTGLGDGLTTVGGVNGHGLRATGGSTSGSGMVAVAGTGSTAAGMSLTGDGGGEGLTCQGGATGHGAEFIGGATSGDGVRARAATSGVGITATGVGANAGVLATGGATGDGIKASGGATSGSGMELVGTGGQVDLDSDIQVTSFSTAAKAEINTEVLDVLTVDTFGEPTGVPAASATIAGKVGRVYQALRNKLTVDGTHKTLYDDAGSAQWRKPIADSAGVYTEDEGTTP